ncbi:hypothetical protein, partial [Escherichia coli]|uniref:hypothetical protein n=1 Tax=Escherichia coli TaxID=562 RepID=UPI00244B7303
TTDELRHALTTGIQSRKPTIINVVIDPAAGTESGHITKKLSSERSIKDMCHIDN